MAVFKIKQEKDKVIVEVSLPALPVLAVDARELKEVIRVNAVRNYLESQGIKTYSCIQSAHLSNCEGPASSGVFIFSTIDPSAPVVKRKKKAPRSQKKPLQMGEKVEKVIKDLTPAEEPVIIEEQPKKKRKRVKRVSKTGNQTTS
jgi:hypothetical protein